MTIALVNLAPIQPKDLPEAWDDLVTLGKECLRVSKIADITFARVCQAMLDGFGSKTLLDVANALGCSDETVRRAVKALKITKTTSGGSDDHEPDQQVSPDERGDDHTSADDDHDEEAAYDEALRQVRRPRSASAEEAEHEEEETGNLNEPLGATEAQKLTTKIKKIPADVVPLIAEAFHRRADAAMGYRSWDRYCKGELDSIELWHTRNERRAMVKALDAAGVPKRPISHALGMDERTVRGDLKITGSSRPAPDPAACTGPTVIPLIVDTSPLHFAQMAESVVAEIDAEEYRPDGLTTAQRDVLDELRAVLAKFAQVWKAEEERIMNEEDAAYAAQEG